MKISIASYLVTGEKELESRLKINAEGPQNLIDLAENKTLLIIIFLQIMTLKDGLLNLIQTAQ